MRVASAQIVRATIAARVLGTHEEHERLGEIELYQHQRDAVARVRRLLEEQRGALLADEVGLGKTFVALAIAKGVARVAVVAPAALRASWIAAAERACVHVQFLSIERLSRAQPVEQVADLVIVDEAHHFRNRRTRRFAAACVLCRDAKVLLLSATPVQNRLSDLQTVLSLFLGERSYALSVDALSRFVIRRNAEGAMLPESHRLPRVLAARWLESVQDVDCLDRLMALPRAVPPVDGDDGGLLLTYTLARQWASSRAALLGALHRRLARGGAMLDSLRAGRRPSRAELRAWTYSEGSQQLAFPELIVGAAVDSGLAALLHHSQAHIEAVRDLVGWLRSTPDPDVVRVAALSRLLTSHAGERIIAFSEYTDTIAALFRALMPRARVAMLTHAGGCVAGGSISRSELLSRFGPGASRSVAASDRIDLLLTTDVLSEGVNLQDASVVVHLDLAWNPARLEQRVGRLRRIGAARDVVSVYMFAPPAPAERFLAIERRLRIKSSAAARAVGVAGEIIPGFAHTSDSVAQRNERQVTLLRRWLSTTASAQPVRAAVRSERSAALACVSLHGGVRLVALVDDGVTDATPIVEELLSKANGAEVPIETHQSAEIVDRLERWLRRRVVGEIVDLPALRVGRARQVILRRVESIARRIPRHSRPQVVALMHAARVAATVTLSAGAELVLDELADAPLDDHAWLKAVGEFAAVHTRDAGRPPEILALLLLCAP